jgi:hypothetical protein
MHIFFYYLMDKAQKWSQIDVDTRKIGEKNKVLIL